MAVGLRRAIRAAGLEDSNGIGGASRDAVVGGVGSTLNTHPSPGSVTWPYIQNHLGILRPEGLDSLGDISIVDVAAVDLEEIAEGGRIIAGTLKCGSKFVM